MKLLESLIKPVHAQSDLGVPEPDYAVSSIGNLLSGLVNAAIVIGALAAFLYLILGGLQWITAGGDKTKTEEAQKKITNAIIGLVIIAAAYAIITVVVQFLGLGDISSLSLPAIE